jgi:hypothetical protein
MAQRLDVSEDLYDWLSNVELGVVLDGGSAAVLAAHPLSPGVFTAAHVDLDGLWVDEDSGYVRNVCGWRVDRYY